MPDGSRWAERSTFSVGWSRVGDAALQAAKNPWVWAPMAGAAVMQIDDWDQRVSDWAYDTNPVFGSPKSAQDWSEGLVAAAGVGYAASLLATPSGSYGTDWWSAKWHGGLVGLGAIAASSLTTEGLKRIVSRERPDGDENGFPSAHASLAGVADTLTVRNLRAIPLGEGTRTALSAGAAALTLATGWARIESGAHYPSDVLAGMSIGNFFGLLFTDAFLRDGLSERVAFAIEPVPDGGRVVWQMRF